MRFPYGKLKDLKGAQKNFDYLQGKLTTEACRVYKSAAQPIANGVVDWITFDTENYDTNGLHDNAVLPTRITVKRAGIYDIMSHTIWDINGVGDRYTDLLVNSANIICSARGNANASSTTNFPMCAQYKLAANDYIELRAYQISGGPLNMISGPSGCWMSAKLSGAE